MNEADFSDGGTVLAFMNEVAGGRKLLEAVRERVEAGADSVAVAAPQNQPMSGQIVDRDELRDAAQSRVEVTQAVLAEFGIDSHGAIFDPDPPLALDDAVRGFGPREVLALVPARDPLRTRPQGPGRCGPRAASTSRSPTSRSGSTTTRCAGTSPTRSSSPRRPSTSPDLVDHLKSSGGRAPAPLHDHLARRSGALTREEVCERLARTLAELYRTEIDATGQPMSPAPLAAVENAIEHYRVDEILISTLAGEQSKWVAEGLIDDVKAKTDMPVEHFEAGGGTESATRLSPWAWRRAPVQGNG